MYPIYRYFVSLYFNAIGIASFFRKDAKKWLEGRKDWIQKAKSFDQSQSKHKAKRIWFHVSSLGEFEQGRTLIEIIRKNHPEKRIILSFFSPSGYDKCKNYASADYVCYFPSDKYSEIKKFITILKPDLVVFVKYDFWFNTLDVLKKEQIPFFFISVLFKKNHFLFHPVFRSLLNKLKAAKQIFLQNSESLQLLKSAGFENIQKAGDTRLDRVYSIAHQECLAMDFSDFNTEALVFIAGSIWKEDVEKIKTSILKAIKMKWHIILVPHKIDEDQLIFLESAFPGLTRRYTDQTKSNYRPIIILDQIGMLSSLYSLCDFAYVGGGFGKGIHNILEPAAHGKAVCFGPNYAKFQEAHDFIQLGIGSVIQSHFNLDELFINMADSDVKSGIKTLVDKYFSENLGASQKIYQYLISQRLLDE